MQDLLFVKSREWSFFENYLKDLQQKETNRLIHAVSEQDMFVSQGKLRVYETLLKLKEQVE